jgi:N-acyl-D-amino-acid deacylase
MKKKITRRDFLKQTSRITAAAGLSGCGLLLKGCQSKQDFDLVIKNGHIYDGFGRDPFQADLGIKDDRIVEIGKIAAVKAKDVIEAHELAVTPGFIDVHDHTDVELLVNPRAESAVHQGITSLISGNCGSSVFPVADEILEEKKAFYADEYGVDMNWTDIKGFFSRLSDSGMAVNYATFVGHGSVRGASMGFNDRPSKPKDLEKMRILIEDNIKDGAVGLSTGFEYSPGSFAQPQEVLELCAVVSRLGGIHSTHMRSEGDFLLESLDETIDIARKTGVNTQVSHFKVAYPANWHKVDDALKKIDAAHQEGIRINCDRYPYIAGSTSLDFNFPLWSRQGTTEDFVNRLKDPMLETRMREHIDERERKIGSWDKVRITQVSTEKNRHFEGKSVLQGAKETQKDPFSFMRDLLIEENNNVGMVIFMMKEENLEKILAHPLVGVGCDGAARAPYGVLGEGKPHPRSYGTFPRVLGRYVRGKKILSLPEAVRKTTSVPALKFGFSDRGVIQKGFLADIVIFDPATVIDKAAFSDPHQYPEGIHYVLVNGQVVIDRKEHTDRLPGRILRKEI